MMARPPHTELCDPYLVRNGAVVLTCLYDKRFYIGGANTPPGGEALSPSPFPHAAWSDQQSRQRSTGRSPSHSIGNQT